MSLVVISHLGLGLGLGLGPGLGLSGILSVVVFCSLP